MMYRYFTAICDVASSFCSMYIAEKENPVLVLLIQDVEGRQRLEVEIRIHVLDYKKCSK